MAIEHGMDGAPGGNPHIAIQPSDQQLAQLTRSPMRLLLLQTDDQALHLGGELVGIAHRPPRAVAERLEPVFLVTIEDLVAGLA